MSVERAVSVLERSLAATKTEGVEHSGDLLERLYVARRGIEAALDLLDNIEPEGASEPTEWDVEYPTHREQREDIRPW